MSRRKLFAVALFAALCALPLAASAQAQDPRAQAAAEIESFREQIKAREAILVAPSAEDAEAFAEFLAKPGTGLVRLLPRERWDGKLSMRGDGAYYSFTRLTHEYGYGSDIQLEQDNFSVGFAGANFGFLVNMGNVPLEGVSKATDSVQYMAAFQTPLAEPEARKAHLQFSSGGHRAGQWTYRNRLPVVLNNTYAVRSVNYDGSDVLVAFRVVRKDFDGSVVLLWKMLKKFPKPGLERTPPAASASAGS
jgi:hypothetical protein